MELNYNEVVKFMKDFEVDVLNRFDELIIDYPTNTYVYIGGCKDIDDVKTRVVYALCRPIGKGLEKQEANRLLKRLNKYFKTNLTKEDLLLMYQELCYERKLPEFREFVLKGLPIEELKNITDN